MYCEARESGETIYRPAPKEGKWVCAQLCQTLCDPMDCSPPGSSVMRFPRQKYWSELPFPTPGDLPDPGIKPVSPALADGFFTAAPAGKASEILYTAVDCFSLSLLFPSSEHSVFFYQWDY